MSAVRGKILCLPGYLQNGKVFAEKSSGIRKLLTKKLNLQLDYIDPPNIIETKEQLPFTLGENEEESTAKWNAIVEQDLNRCWWVHKDPGTYEGFSFALQYIADYIKKNGPYDGILGFSQGGAMAAIVTNTVHELVPTHPHFKVAVFFSGFVFTQPVNKDEHSLNINHQTETVDEYKTKVKVVDDFTEKFTYPTGSDVNTKVINIYGSSDNTVPGVRSAYLSTFYPSEALTEFNHEGGHFIPNKKPFLNPIVEIIKDVFEDKEEKSNL